MYVTIYDGNFRQLYNISTSTPGSWHALRPGGQRVRAVLFAGLKYSSVISTCLLNIQRHDQVVHISLISLHRCILSQCDMNKYICLILLARYRPTLVLQSTSYHV